MSRRCAIARDAALRDKVHGLVAQGLTIDAIVHALPGDKASRSVVGRYVHSFRQMHAELASVQCSEVSPELDEAMRDQVAELAAIQKLLCSRDVQEKEAIRRAELSSMSDSRPRSGASPESLALIKAELLGLDVEY